MSVEGVPSVDDVATAVVEFTRTTGDGFVLFSDEVRELGIAAYPKEVEALAEAVHALYAPVLDMLARERDEALGVIDQLGEQIGDRQPTAVRAEAARYREALEKISQNVCDHDSYTSCSCGFNAEQIADEALSPAARSALVEPKGQAEGDSAA